MTFWKKEIEYEFSTPISMYAKGVQAGHTNATMAVVTVGEQERSSEIFARQKGQDHFFLFGR